MATHSSILAWKIPMTGEPGRFQSIGLQRVSHDWSNLTQHTHTQHFIVHMYHNFFIHSSVDGYLGLLPCHNYCKQCCSECWGACVFLNYGFLRVYAQQWDCWVVWQFYSQCFKKSPYGSPQWLYQFTFSPTVQEGSLFSTYSPAFVVYRFLNNGCSEWCEVIPH